MVWSNPRATMPDEVTQVMPEEAGEYGYHGLAPDFHDDNELYTLAGAVKVAEQEAKEREEREAEIARNDPANKSAEAGKHAAPARRSTQKAKEDG